MIVAEEIFQAFLAYSKEKNSINSSPPVFLQESLSQLCSLSCEILSKEPTLLDIQTPTVIVGDLHGNLRDLMMLLEVFKAPPDTNYLFLGDYVDRGERSTHVLVLLLCLMCMYPTKVFLIRGNHEFCHINKVYGFFTEVISLGYTESLWEDFQTVFSYLPLAAVVFNSIFCVHGGISPHLLDLSTISSIPRPITNYFGTPLISDIVWSDPTDIHQEFSPNQRGSGVLFGYPAVNKFLAENHLKLLVRAHQCTANGIDFFANNLGVTVFSCSDYAGIERNKCGVMQVNEVNDITLHYFNTERGIFSQEKRQMTLMPDRMGLHSLILRRPQISHQQSQPYTRKNRMLSKSDVTSDTNFPKVKQNNPPKYRLPLIHDSSQPVLTISRSQESLKNEEVSFLPQYKTPQKEWKKANQSSYTTIHERRSSHPRVPKKVTL